MKCSRGIKRKFIKQASIFLLLGVIVNVAVAWGFAWFTPTFSNNERKHYDVLEDGVTSYTTTIGEVTDEYFTSDKKESPLAIVSVWTDEIGGLTKYTVFGFNHPHGSANMLTLVRTGFPMNCLTYNYWTLYGFPLGPIEHLSSRYALLWKPSVPSRENDDRVVALPLRPLWPEFAINTIFYGMILWMLLVVPFEFLRWRRKRRGLCIACGYPVGTSPVCTECGN